MDTRDPAQHIAYNAVIVIYLIAAQEAWFYWTHRLLHHPSLYWIHAWHHKSHNPSPWTAYAFHPIESVVQCVYVPLVLGLVPLRVSDLALAIAVTLQLFQNIYAHGGFELFPPGWISTPIGRNWNSSVHHVLHHKSGKGNFGLYTCVWDRALGTLIPETESTFVNVTEYKIH